MSYSQKKDLEQLIIEILSDSKKPLKAREIAAIISRKTENNISAKEINSCLYYRLKGKTWQDNQYKWTLREKRSSSSREKGREYEANHETEEPRSDSWKRFSNYINYYIECIQEDERPESYYFASNEGSDFINLPLDSEWNISDKKVITVPLESENSKFRFQLQKKKTSGALYYGYPLYIKWIERSAKGWKGAFAMPVFLQHVEYELNRSELSAELIYEWPRVNGKFLNEVFKSQEERKHFLDELGLLQAEGDPPDDVITDIVLRMKELDYGFDHIENINPECIENKPKIGDLNKTGLYNRAILAVGEKSKFTAGVEKELKLISQRQSDWELNNSSLRLFFNPDIENGAAEEEKIIEPIIEVVPLNEEQRSAVQSAFVNPLTVVTGPPGTGKSQVVLTLLANAYLKKQKVLFTSRNHKAVDVVQDRLHAISGFPLAIRTGTRKGTRNLRAELTDFLTQILSITIDSEDIRRREEIRNAVDALTEERQNIWDEVEEIRLYRNRLNELDERIEDEREKISNETWAKIKVFKLDNIPPRDEIEKVLAKIIYHQRTDIGFYEKIIRWLKRNADFSYIYKVEETFLSIRDLSISSPSEPLNKFELETWRAYFSKIMSIVIILELKLDYDNCMNELSQLKKFENLAVDMLNLEENLWEKSEELISIEGKLLPDRIKDASIRKSVGEYQATLKRLAEDQIGGKIYANLMREQEGLFKAISDVLPVWCVTNLSARGSLPLENSLFDLLIIDEASQCDIPSAIPLFFRAKRVVIIGDPNQLQHISTIEKHRAQQLEVKYGLTKAEDQPYTFVNNSLFSLGVTSLGQAHVITLKEHFRSHEDIINYSNKQWYRSSLRVCTDYRKLKTSKDDKSGIVWTKVKGRTTSPSGGGALNVKEAETVASKVCDLLENKRFQGSVGVVTPFRKQANRIWDLISKKLDISTIENASLIIDTAHGFQGDERDIIFFSPCVTPLLPKGAKYFLSSTGNLFNVAITRARSVLHVVGDIDACANCGVKFIEDFASYVAGLDKKEEPKKDSYIDPNDPKIGFWEIPFFNALKKAGLNPIPQYPVNQYRLDFAFFEGEVELDVEVDGEYYHKEWNGQRCKEDVFRDIRLMALGWNVLRFWVYQIRDDMDACVKEVFSTLEDLR